MAGLSSLNIRSHSVLEKEGEGFYLEFEPQIPSNSASAPSQAHLPMLLTQPGRSSIQPLHRSPVVLTSLESGFRFLGWDLWMKRPMTPCGVVNWYD